MQGIRFFGVMRVALLSAAMLLGGSIAAGGASAQISFDSQFATGIPRAAGLGDSLAATPDGSLLMINDKNGRIFRFDGEGQTLPGWNHGQKGAMAIATDPAGNVLVAADDRIERFTASGERLKTWNLRSVAKRGPLGFFFPTAMDVADSGMVYIADLLTARVVRLSPKGKFLGEFKQADLARGRMAMPGDIAIGLEGRVYIADGLGNRVGIYSPEGRFLKGWGKSGTGHGGFESTASIATDELGRVYVGDSILSRIQVFDPDGNFLDQRGSEGFGPSRFSRMGDIAIHDSGAVYVADREDKRIQRFTYTDAAHTPQAQLQFRGTKWVVSGRPGTRVELPFLVANFGDLAADGVKICPKGNSGLERKLLHGVGCQTIGSIEPRTRKIVRFRVQVPPKTKKKQLRTVKLRLSSTNAGGGWLGMGIYTGPKFHWPEMASAERKLGRESPQSVAMRLRARGAPGN